jgi:hypothetical protein
MKFRAEVECSICSAVYKEDDFVTCPGVDCPGEKDKDNKE